MPTFEFALREPGTRDEIVTQLRELHRASIAFWNGFSTDAFFAPVGTGWSPAGNVRHLNKAIQPLAQALKLPRLLPRVLFGKAKQPSRTYAEVRDTYLATLAAGGGAGKFAPDPEPPHADPAGERARLMNQHEELATALAAVIERWSEEDLDAYQLPHPLIGKLTVREMLCFTVYHNLHHVQSVATRLQGPAPANAGAPAVGVTPD